MTHLKFTKEALFDIENIVLWNDEQREGLSFDFELCLEVGLTEITRNPDIFQKRYKNVKIHFIARFPFGIHYVIKENDIIVIGIFHTSRSPKNWNKRI